MDRGSTTDDNAGALSSESLVGVCFFFFFFVIKRYIYKRRFIIQDRNKIDGSPIEQLIAVQIQSALSRLYNMWHLQVAIVYFNLGME